MKGHAPMDRWLWIVCAALVVSLGCRVGGDSRRGTLTDGVTPISSCDECTFVGHTGMCLASEFEAAKTARSNPQYGQAIADADAGCPEGEICVLCNDPKTGDDTGACGLAPLACPGDDRFPTSSCEKPFSYTNLELLEDCGPGAVCLSYAYIDDDELIERVDPCPQDPSKACVPTFVVETAGFFTLDSCVGLAGAEGRCLPLALPGVAAIEEFLPQSTCPPDFRCSTCFDPLTGEDTGVCAMGGNSEVSCDSPASASPTLYPECEDGRGRCVNEDRFSEDSRDSFRRRDCQNNYLCVPWRILDGEYTNCVGDNPADGNYLGTCLDTNVMVIDNASRLDDEGFCQSVYGSGHRCVPCWREGEDTGAPGCPDDPSEYTPDWLID